MINGTTYDYENIRIDVDGFEDIGIRSINYEDTVETEKQFGAGREAIDATEGVYEAQDGTMTMLWYAYRNMIERMGNGNMSKSNRFDISVSFAHEGEETQTDTLERCRIIGKARDHEQGPEGLEVEVTIQIMKILENGIDPINANP